MEYPKMPFSLSLYSSQRETLFGSIRFDWSKTKRFDTRNIEDWPTRELLCTNFYIFFRNSKQNLQNKNTNLRIIESIVETKDNLLSYFFFFFFDEFTTLVPITSERSCVSVCVRVCGLRIVSVSKTKTKTREKNQTLFYSFFVLSFNLFYLSLFDCCTNDNVNVWRYILTLTFQSIHSFSLSFSFYSASLSFF